MTKILLLGLGRWGANHLRNLNNLPIELYVAEVGDKQLEPARKLGIPAKCLTTNYKDFIGKVDGVVVVTPAQSHFPLCREFLEAGKDVFVEKPLTLANEESKQLEPARKLNIPAARLTTNYKDFAGKVDCAVIVTPAQTHFSLCKEFLEAGKDVFVEKPLTLANEESKQLAELALCSRMQMEAVLDPTLRYPRDMAVG